MTPLKENAPEKPSVCLLLPPQLKGILIRVAPMGPSVRLDEGVMAPLSGGLHEFRLEIENRTDHTIERVDVTKFRLRAPGKMEQTLGMTQRVCNLGPGQRARLYPARVSLPVPGIYSMSCRLENLQAPALWQQAPEQAQTLQWIESRGQIGRGWSDESDRLRWSYPFTVADRVAHQQTRLARWAVLIGVASVVAAIIQLARLLMPGGS